MEDKELLTVYTAKDIQQIFKCGRKKAYEIMHAKGFPSFRINSSIYVEKKKLEAWVAKHTNDIVIT